jgi:type II secretory pathway predicted ATPase ExeA
MLLEKLNLREQPFGVTPDPRFFYPSTSHREALASLVYGVQSDRAFMAMIAQPGMGKTMLLFNLLQQLGATARTAFLFQTQCDSREFLGYLLTDLGLNVCGYDPIRMHEELKAELLKEAHAGRKVVLVVDEAQNLSTSVLETIRLLSDFENPRRKLVQIILAGQPQLGQKLASPELVQLRQRLSLIIQIKPLSREEIATYIARRLQVAGYSGPALFTPEAVGLIAGQSRGIPRIVNNYCFNALSIACATQKDEVSAEMVAEVARDLDLVDLLAVGNEAEENNDTAPIDLPIFAPEPIAALAPGPAAAPLTQVATNGSGGLLPVSSPLSDLHKDWPKLNSELACLSTPYSARRNALLVPRSRNVSGSRTELEIGVFVIIRKLVHSSEILATRVSPGWSKGAATQGNLATLAAMTIVRGAKALESATVFASQVAVPAAQQLVLRTRTTLKRARFSAIPFLLRLRRRMAHRVLSLINSFNPRPKSASPMTRLPTTARNTDFVECKAEGANV